MKFIDFFAGIGGFRLGMEQAGHECVGHCEIDKFADKSYRAMHDVKESEWYADDIRGTMSNGRCLTAQPLESPKTGKECSLLDILEEQVDEKYCLSEDATRRLLSYQDKQVTPLQQGQEQQTQSERMLLKINSMHKSN